MPAEKKPKQPKYIRFRDFVMDYGIYQRNALDKLVTEKSIVVSDPDFDAVEERIEELIEVDDWEEKDMTELSALFLALAYATHVRAMDGESDDEGEDDDDAG